MRINLTKKDLVNLVYMQLGFSKQISENLIEEFFSLISNKLKRSKKIKDFKIWDFFFKRKKTKNWKKSKNKRRKKNFKKKCYII